MSGYLYWYGKQNIIVFFFCLVKIHWVDYLNGVIFACHSRFGFLHWENSSANGACWWSYMAMKPMSNWEWSGF